MTTVPDTITLPADDKAALIVRCAIQLASLSIRQLDRDAKGWTAQERAEGIAHAEKATPCAQDGQQPAFESEALHRPKQGVSGNRKVSRKEALKISAETLARAEQERIDAAVREAPHATE